MIKKLFAAAAAAAMFMSCAVTAFARTEYQETEVSAPPKMLVMGDSIATGFNLEGYSEGRDNCPSYANLLKEKYSAELPEDCGFTLKNIALDGQTSEQLLNSMNAGQLDGEFADADCIVISIGGNDLLHAIWDTFEGIDFENWEKPSTSEIIKVVTRLGGLKKKLDENLDLFDKNLASIAKYIRSKTKGEIIFQTLYDPLENFSMIPGVSGIAEEKIGRLNEIIKTHAGDASSRYTICDVAESFKGRAEELTRINSMDIHPTEEGHKVIYEQLADVIGKFTFTYQKAVEIPDPEPAEKPAQPAAAVLTDSADTDSGSNSLLIVFCAAGTAIVGAGAVVSIIIMKKRTANLTNTREETSE